MNPKLVIAGYFGSGTAVVSLLHVWYAAAAYGGRLRVGLPFLFGLDATLPAAYCYVLAIGAGIATFLVLRQSLALLAPLSELTVAELVGLAPPGILLGTVLVFLPQFSGASWSKAVLTGLVVLTGGLVVVSYAYTIPFWEVVVVYLSLIFGLFTIGGEWLSYAGTVQEAQFRSMTYFTLSSIYIVGASFSLLYENLRTPADGSGAGTGRSRGPDPSGSIGPTGSISSPTPPTSGDAPDGPASTDVTATLQREAPEARPWSELAAEDLPTLADLAFVEHAPIRPERASVLTVAPRTRPAVEILRTLCVEVARERTGRSPTSVIVRDPEDLFGDLLWRIERGVVTVLLDEPEWEAVRAERRARLWDRLDRFVLDDGSIVVLAAEDPPVPEEYHVGVDRFVPRDLPADAVARLAELSWGYVAAEGTPPRFTRHRERMLERLESLRTERDGLYADATAERSAEESRLHIALKRLVVRWLVTDVAPDAAGSPEEIASRIRTDATVAPGVRADVAVGGDAFAVETLYRREREATGERNQLQHAFTRFGDAGDVERVHVVLDTITAIRYLDEVVRLKHNHRGWERTTGTAVEFYVANVAEGRLVHLTEFAGDVLEVASTLDRAAPYGDAP